MANLQKIKQLAYNRGVQLKDVASACGISPSALTAMIKSGTTTVQTLERIAVFLNVPVSVFFDDTDTPSVSFTGSGNNTAVHGTVTIGDTRLAIETLREQLHVKDEQIMELIKRIK